MDLVAKSAEDLLRSLSQVDISVSPREEGRTNEQRERWSICRLLAAIAESEWISYPLQLQKRERPDFLLHVNSSFVGIEVTEVIPPDWARVDVRRSELAEDHVILLQRFRPGEPSRSFDEIDRIARGQSESDGWSGDSPEREWAAAMLYSLERKVETAKKPGFQLFDKNWILMYDNWPLPAVDEPKAAAYLMQRIVERRTLLPLDVFFVECEHIIWRFDSDGYAAYPIPNLWNG